MQTGYRGVVGPHAREGDDAGGGETDVKEEGEQEASGDRRLDDEHRAVPEQSHSERLVHESERPSRGEGARHTCMKKDLIVFAPSFRMMFFIARR